MIVEMPVEAAIRFAFKAGKETMVKFPLEYKAVMVKFPLEYKAVINIQDDKAQIFASYNGHGAIVKLLLKSRAERNARSQI